MFCLPLTVGLCSSVIPSYVLERIGHQDWAQQYKITYTKGETRSSNHHHLHHDEIEERSLFSMFLSSFFAALVLYLAQVETLSYDALCTSITAGHWMLQCACLIYAIDFFQYLLHYLGHKSTFLWKHVHSMHHQIHTPSALQCAYGSVCSTCLGGALPILLACALVRPHATVFYVAAANQTISFGPYGHCGMCLPLIDILLGYGIIPFRATPFLHDAHHRISGRRATNLGTTIWLWDWIFGTLDTDRV